MSGVREHLRKAHTHAAEHHLEMAKGHAALAGHYHRLADAMHDDGETANAHADIAAEHEHMRDAHLARGEYHTDCAKAMGKAADDELEKLAPLPSGFSNVHEVPPGLRAVQRSGGAPIPAGGDNILATIFDVEGS